jgi:diguanylate cyclase (GGDEF)-like protein/PAS domain S-box-containing protein
MARSHSRGCGALLLTALLLSPCATAGTVARFPRFENINTEQGLPQDTVAAIEQDHVGFLWFGTQAGLVRYDGYRFEAFHADGRDGGSLGDNFVTAIREDENHRLWVGTRAGLYRLSADRSQFESLVAPETLRRGLGDRTVRAIVISPPGGDGAAWIGTADGLQRIDAASGAFRIWYHEANGQGLSGDDVQALTWDAEGRLWIGTTKGLERLTPSSGEIVRVDLGGETADAPLRQSVRSLLWADDRLWVGTKAGVAVVASPAGSAAPSLQSERADIPRDEVRALGRDSEGTVWVGMFGKGLYRVGIDEQITHYRHRTQDVYSLASDEVASIFHDRSGTLWIGTWTGGLSRLDLASGGFERHLSIEGDAETLSDPRVYGIAGDGRGGLWFATLGAGLDHVDANGRRRNYRHDPTDPQSLPDDRAFATATDRQGRIWVGTRLGFGRLDPDSGRFERVHPTTVAPELARAVSVRVDRAGTVWFGSDGGLHRYTPDTQQLTTFVHDPSRADSLSQGRVYVVFEDSRGRLWIGTHTGLDRLDGASGVFTHFRHDPLRPDSLRQDSIKDLFEDRRGGLWIATAGGVSRMDVDSSGKPTFRTYSRGEGQGTDSLGAVAGDAAGRIWFSSSVGISRLDPDSGDIRQYTRRDGLNTGGFYNKSGYTAPDGTIYFGGFNGVVSFLPATIRENPLAPVVVLSGLRIAGKPVRPEARPASVTFDGAFPTAIQLSLGHDISDFTIEFAALHFADPTRNRYAHRLDGFDRDWIETDASQRSATYTNLDPGDYVFRVKASNKDGVWNKTGATLAITVLPPWWGTWWFRAAALALLVSAVVAVHRLRVRALTRQRERLTREVDARTHEVVRQKEQLEQGHRDLSVLGAIGREITAMLDERAVCETLDRHVRALLDAAAFAVYRQEPDDRGLAIAWRSDAAAAVTDARIRLDDLADRAVRCARERREIVEEIGAGIGGGHPCAALFVPLLIGERVLGVMTVQSRRSGAYDERERQIFRTLCAYGAIALDNAAVYLRLAQTDAALSRTLREQELLFDNAAAAIFFVKGRTICRANRGMEEMLGYAPGELLGESTEIYYLSRESWEDQGRAIYPLISAGRVAEGEWEVRRKDGSRIWIAYRGRALDAEDMAQGSIWIAHDISERRRTAAALERALREQQILFDNELGGMMFVRDRVVARCNRGLEIILGYGPGELAGCSTRQFFASDDAWAAFGERVLPQLVGGAIARGDVEYVRKDGRCIWVSYNGKAIDANDIAEGIIWVGQDITERKRAELLLREGKQQVEQALAEVERTQGQLAQLSELSGFLQACASATEAYFCVAEYGPRLFPQALGALYLLDDSGALLVEKARWGDWPAGSALSFGSTDCWALRRGQPYRVERSAGALCCPHVARRSGRAEPYACLPLVAQGRTFGLLFVEHGAATPTHGLVTALAEQIGLALANLRLRDALQQQSFRDPLTGLFNRRYLHEWLARELPRIEAEGAELSVMMIDVDHFKKFNDTFGHHAGDVVLQGVAQLIGARFRDVDVACRFGGEEFIVLLPSCPAERADARAQDLLRAVRALRLAHDNRALDRVTASLGLAQFPLHGGTAAALIAAADAALYQAKLAGRDRVVKASCE